MSKPKGSILGLLVLLSFLTYFAFTFVDQQRIIYAKRMEMGQIESKIMEEQKNNEKLKKQKEMVNSDEYIEKMAREKLGMVKQGEKVFIDTNK